MPDFPTDREEWEAKVTALLLGELPPEEAEAVRRQIAQDPALAQWQAQLELTMGLVRESLQSPPETASPQAPPLRLSETKREQLLAHFKTVKVKQSPPARAETPRWILWSAAAAAALVLAAMLMPSLGRAKQKGLQLSIQQNLRLFDAAKQQWALEKGHSQSDTPTMDEIRPYFGHGAETGDPIAGETYVIGPVDKVPVAITKHGIVMLPGNTLDETALGAPSPQPAASESLALKKAKANQPESVATAGTVLAANKDLSTWSAAVTPPAPVEEPSQQIVANQSQETRGASPLAGEARSRQRAYYGAAPTLGDTPAAGSLFSESQAGSPVANPATLAKNEAPPPAAPVPALAPAAPPVPAFSFSGGSDLVQKVATAPTPTVPPPTVDDGFATNAFTIAGIGGVPTEDDREKLDAGRRLARLDRSETTESQPSNVASLNALGYINGVTDSLAAVTGEASSARTNLNSPERLDEALKRAPVRLLTPQPEIKSSENAFSTFSLNVSDASFRLAAATLEKGQLPEPGSVRSEEFLNAFDYRDPEPAPGVKVSFASERCADPFAHNRDFLRFSLKTAAQGREASRPLNIVLLLDKSGSMERADRVAITRKMLDTLAAQLHPSDTISVVVFARTARLWADGVAGDKAADTLKSVGDITPEGGTDLEEAMRIAYQAAARHYQAAGENRVVLLTDGAANLGEVDPASLKKSVETNRAQGIAFDCFGVGWDGYNDQLLETLSRSGGGRYGFINTPEEAVTEFAGQLAGALCVAAYDVKTQVEFNPNRAAVWRQIGYAKDQLTKEQFRDNSVKAAQLGAAESGNALYVVQVNPQGDGPLCTVRVRYRLPDSNEFREQEWPVPYTGTSAPLESATPAMRLAVAASAFSEWLQNSPYAGEVKLNRLQSVLNGVAATYGADTRPKLLETMIQEARSISGQ